MKKQHPFDDVPSVPFDLPRFKNEAEEAEWWQTHREEAANLLERAHKAGAIRQVHGGTPEPTRQTSIRLIARDIERARTIARRKGMRYQTYLKMIVHETIERDYKAS